MNRYFDFFKNMTDEEWEHFATEVLRRAGFQILTEPTYGADGGRDFSAYYNNVIYLVSCKHYINSNSHVGNGDETNISDRMLQFGATGFIGFYSTGISIKLQERLDGICKNANYAYIIFDPPKIIQIMQVMDTKILQAYGLYPHKYYMNVTQEEYRPLKCMLCGTDCLTDAMIPGSLVALAKRFDGKYEYVYGCKSCFIDAKLYAFCEFDMALHVNMLQGWENNVDEWIENCDIEVSDDFYKNRVTFLNLIRQRQLPQTEGNWYGIDF